MLKLMAHSGGMSMTRGCINCLHRVSRLNSEPGWTKPVVCYLRPAANCLIVASPRPFRGLMREVARSWLKLRSITFAKVNCVFPRSNSRA